MSWYEKLDTVHQQYEDGVIYRFVIFYKAMASGYETRCEQVIKSTIHGPWLREQIATGSKLDGRSSLTLTHAADMVGNPRFRWVSYPFWG